KQFSVVLDDLLPSFPVDAGHVYIVTVFSEETTEGGHVMAVPRNCVFGENIAHGTFIVVCVLRAAIIAAIVIPRRVAISVTVAGRPISIVTIPVSVDGVVGRIGISVGYVWVAPVPPVPPVPPRTPNPTPPRW